MARVTLRVNPIDKTLRLVPEIATTQYLDQFMFLHLLKLFASSLFAAMFLTACGGGDPAPPATGVTVTARESTATVSWNMQDGVEYWLFYGPTSIAPADTSTMHGWIGLPGGSVLLKVSSPIVVTGLVNGTSYSFSLNGRTNGGPGGAGTTPVSATPVFAGASWTAGPATSPAANLRAVTYGPVGGTGTVFVTAGEGGAMYSSVDGASWSAITSVTSNRLNGASFFGNYKLVGDAGTVLTSADGLSWTTRTSGTTQNLYAVASNNLNLNVAVGANGTIIASADGTTWVAATSSATVRDLFGVSYGIVNGVGTWVAVGAGGTLVTSTDGLNWHGVTSGTALDLQGVAYGAVTTTSGTTTTTTTTFVAVGASGTVLSSTDAATWTVRTPPAAVDLKAVAYGTQFIAAGNGGNIFTSLDGVTWVASSPTGTTNNLLAVARGDLNYSAVGTAGANLMAR
ncbi:MAG: hypothetical protein Q7J75_00425 [Rhodoferax sp.]|nr:hypothetical protein [Rhodoferax sp.]